jgi:hypothetical protein
MSSSKPNVPFGFASLEASARVWGVSVQATEKIGENTTLLPFSRQCKAQTARVPLNFFYLYMREKPARTVTKVWPRSGANSFFLEIHVAFGPPAA